MRTPRNRATKATIRRTASPGIMDGSIGASVRAVGVGHHEGDHPADQRKNFLDQAAHGADHHRSQQHEQYQIIENRHAAIRPGLLLAIGTDHAAGQADLVEPGAHLVGLFARERADPHLDALARGGRHLVGEGPDAGFLELVLQFGRLFPGSPARPPAPRISVPARRLRRLVGRLAFQDGQCARGVFRRLAGLAAAFSSALTRGLTAGFGSALASASAGFGSALADRLRFRLRLGLRRGSLRLGFRLPAFGSAAAWRSESRVTVLMSAGSGLAARRSARACRANRPARRRRQARPAAAAAAPCRATESGSRCRWPAASARNRAPSASRPRPPAPARSRLPGGGARVSFQAGPDRRRRAASLLRAAAGSPALEARLERARVASRIFVAGIIATVFGSGFLLVFIKEREQAHAIYFQ